MWPGKTRSKTRLQPFNFCFFFTKMMSFWFFYKKNWPERPSQNTEPEPWTGTGLKTINLYKKLLQPLYQTYFMIEFFFFFSFFKSKSRSSKKEDVNTSWRNKFKLSIIGNFAKWLKFYLIYSIRWNHSKSIVYCLTIKQSHILAEKFNTIGIAIINQRSHNRTLKSIKFSLP